MTLDTKNIMQLSFNAMLRELEPMALEPIPSGRLNDPDMMMKLDELLSSFANNYAYLIHLWAFVSAKTNEYKMIGSTNEWSIAAKKKEALYGIAAAIKLKWDAVSRKITVRVETNYGEGKDKRKYDWSNESNFGPTTTLAPEIGDVDDDLPPFHVGRAVPTSESPKSSGWDALG